MAPLATTRTIVRRLTDPDRPRTAVAMMVAASLLLLAAVLVALPTPAEGTDDAPVVTVPDTVDEAPPLIGAAGEVVLAQPDEDVHQGDTIVNLMRDGVTLDARLANGTGLSVELQQEDHRTVRAIVNSDTVHRCGQYAGTLILTGSHPDAPDDVLLLDVRFAECPEIEPPTLAGGSVNDVSPTWADDGRAPWRPEPQTRPNPQPPPPPPPPPPAPAEPAEAGPATAEDEAAPVAASEPDPTTEPTSEPEPTNDPEPTSAPEPTPEPEPEPTSDPTSEPEPESTTTTTAEPSPEG